MSYCLNTLENPLKSATFFGRFGFGNALKNTKLYY